MIKLKRPKELYGDTKKSASDTRARKAQREYADKYYADNESAWNYLVEDADLRYPDAYEDKAYFDPESGTWHFMN